MLRSDIVNDRIRVAQDKARKGIESYKISDRVTNLVATHKLPSRGLAMPTLAACGEMQSGGWLRTFRRSHKTS
jgi:hypothetical protein